MSNAGSTAILLILLGGVSVWLVKQQHTDAQEGLEEARQQKAAMEAAVGERKKEFQVITSALLLRKQVETARAELSAARAQLAAMEAQEKELRQQQRNLAEDARRAQIGTVIPDLVLNDGRRPGQAKVMKIDDDGVSFAISSGVLRASAMDLPPDLRARFHLQHK